MASINNNNDKNIIIEYDFRSNENIDNNHQDKENKYQPLSLKCIQWNIERGYKLDGIINLLKKEDADILCLQELDIDCERSAFRNCAMEIAKSLKLKCIFATEFEEIYSLRRSKKLQGGGVHGNAIMSKFDFTAIVIPHSHHPVDWNAEGEKRGEPRIGRRIILKAIFDHFPLIVYCLHLEVFTGILGRMKQFMDVVNDLDLSIKYQLIFGDLNTVAHGIARFSPNHCCDYLRWKSLGWSEAQWWNNHIFNNPIKNQEKEKEKESKREDETEKEKKESTKEIEISNDQDDLLKKLREFKDPFDANRDITLSSYRGWYKGKLDWTLIKGFSIDKYRMFGNDFEYSDHRGLLVELLFSPVIIN